MKTKILLLTMIAISSLMLNAQTIMNIHQSNGTVSQFPLNTIDSITYTIQNPGIQATILTSSVGSINFFSSQSGGNITDSGGTSVTQRGICYSILPNPTILDNTTNDGAGSGIFSSNLYCLNPNTTYYVRAFAINSAGISYGNEVSFTTTAPGISQSNWLNQTLTYGNVSDLDGNNYSTIIIGTQEWMAENIRTSVYSNGDPIPNVTDVAQWNNLTTGAWRSYNNSCQSEIPHGKLYNWYTVGDTRNVCPTGWHVPSEADWNTLLGFLDPGFNPSIEGTQSLSAGGQLKSVGTQYWNSPNSNATDQFGFSSLPSGACDDNSFFYGLGDETFYWSSTEYNSAAGWYHILNFSDSEIKRFGCNKLSGVSVRCVHD